jgi:hypothetical protein
MNLCEQVLYHALGYREKGSSTTRQGDQGEALCPPTRCPPRTGTPLKMRIGSRLEALPHCRSDSSACGEGSGHRGEPGGKGEYEKSPLPRSANGMP